MSRLGSLQNLRADANLLRLNLMRDLILRKEMRLARRPDGIKFDEKSPIVRLDLEAYHNLKVGDFCIITSDYCLLGETTTPASHIVFYSGTLHYQIMGFVELVGWLKNGRGIKIKDIFAVLTTPVHFPQGERLILYDCWGQLYHCVFSSSKTLIRPVPLFWTGDLKKSEETLTS